MADGSRPLAVTWRGGPPWATAWAGAVLGAALIAGVCLAETSDSVLLETPLCEDGSRAVDRIELETARLGSDVTPQTWSPLLEDALPQRPEAEVIGRPSVGLGRSPSLPSAAGEAGQRGGYREGGRGRGVADGGLPLLGPLRRLGHSGRHQGVGQPLLCESWRYRPFGVGWFMGMMQGSTMIDDWTGTDTGFFGGYRLTWDYDHYWGCEFRYGFASLPQWDSLRAKIAQEQEDTLHGLSPTDPRRHRYDRRRDMDVNVWDVSFIYYPWGDSAWRPYAQVGLGGSRIGFDDRLARHYTNRVLAMPVGVGLKYRWNSRWALRFEVLDNIIFGANGVQTLHNLSATAGVELRFGGTRKAYWPYNPGTHYW